MVLHKKITLWILFCLVAAYGYQPQMANLPRWSEGIGVQGGFDFLSYYNVKNNGDDKVNYEVYSSWLEQTYSFAKEIGIATRQQYYKETEPNLNYGAFHLMLPVKYFFDSNATARNLFLTPTAIYVSHSQKLFSGATFGFFYETFKVYFVTSAQTIWQINDKGDRTKTFEGKCESLFISDIGYHILYDKLNNSGLWTLMRIQFHNKENRSSHFTLQPSLMLYLDSINIIARVKLPIWQKDAENKENNYGLSIGISSAW